LIVLIHGLGAFRVSWRWSSSIVPLKGITKGVQKSEYSSSWFTVRSVPSIVVGTATVRRRIDFLLRPFGIDGKNDWFAVSLLIVLSVRKLDGVTECMHALGMLPYGT